LSGDRHAKKGGLKSYIWGGRKTDKVQRDDSRNSLQVRTRDSIRGGVIKRLRDGAFVSLGGNKKWLNEKMDWGIGTLLNRKKRDAIPLGKI